MAYLSRQPARPARPGVFASRPPPGLGGGVRAFGGLLWAALPMAAIWTFAGVGVARLWRHALADPAFVVGGGTMVLDGAAAECPEARDELIRLGATTEGRNLLDPRLMNDVRAAYAQSPWIREVKSVRRVLPNRLEVVYRLRLPVAQAWHHDGYWLLDMEGRLLPVESKRWAAPGLPLIEADGPDGLGLRPEVGKVWRARAVQDALGLLAAVWGSPLAESAAPVRVVVSGGEYTDREGRRRERRPQLAFHTAAGRHVRWGSFNEGDLPDEMTSAEKLWLLAEWLARAPEAASGGEAYVIDVATPVVTVAPATEADGAVAR